MTTRNLNDLLESRAPAVIASLREQFPGDDDFFRADMTLGDARASVAPAVYAVAARQAHIDASVPVLRAELDKIIDLLGAGLRRARRIQFAASAIATASSGGLVTAALKVGPLAGDTQALSLSAVSFVSSLLALGSDLISGGKDFNARALFDQCAAMSKELLDIELKSKRISSDSASLPLLETLLDRLDAVAVAVQEVGVTLKLR